MRRLPGISQREAVRVFQKLEAITIGAIARDAGLTPQQFRELL